MTQIEVFPVSLVPITDSNDVVHIIRNGRRKRCNTRTIWYADWHDQRRGRHMHHAQDIFAPAGSLVLAPNDGVIVGSSSTSGATPRGGHWIRLAVRDGLDRTVRTYYLAHLRREPLVERGDRVVAGQAIGEVGQTGNAIRTCPHLHIGARRYQRGRPIQLYHELVAVDPTVARRRMTPRPTTPRPAPSEPAQELEEIDQATAPADATTEARRALVAIHGGRPEPANEVTEDEPCDS